MIDLVVLVRRFLEVLRLNLILISQFELLILEVTFLAYALLKLLLKVSRSVDEFWVIHLFVCVLLELFFLA